MITIEYEVLKIYRRKILFTQYKDKFIELSTKINIASEHQTPLDTLIDLSNKWDKLSSREQMFISTELVGVHYRVALYLILTNDNNCISHLVDLKNLTSQNCFQFLLHNDKEKYNLYKVFKDDLRFNISHEQQEYLDFLYKVSF